MTWREAYLRQSKSDYALFEDLNRTLQPLCHQLHYFQMTTEKLAKSYLCHGTNRPPRQRSHFALVRLLQVAKGRPEIRRALRYDNAHAFSAFIDSLLPFARQVEELAPVGAIERPNPEYPWEDATDGDVVSPVDYPFAGFGWRETKMIHLKSIVHALVQLSD